jgi:hypothetical protein
MAKENWIECIKESSINSPVHLLQYQSTNHNIREGMVVLNITKPVEPKPTIKAFVWLNVKEGT